MLLLLAQSQFFLSSIFPGSTPVSSNTKVLLGNGHSPLALSLPSSAELRYGSLSSENTDCSTTASPIESRRTPH